MTRESSTGGGALYGSDTWTRQTRVSRALIGCLRERLKDLCSLSLWRIMNDGWADRQRERERRQMWQLCAWVWDRQWHLLFLSVRVNDVCGFCCPLGSHMCNYSQTVTRTVSHLLHTALKNGETWLKSSFSLLRATPGNEACWLIVGVSNQLHIGHDSTLMHCQQSLLLPQTTNSH